MPAIVPVNFEGIPADLKAIPQWVCWIYGDVRDGGKREKPPIDAKTGEGASATDPNTWSDYETAKQAYEESNGAYAGVGFVPTREVGLVIADGDKCRDPNTGELKAEGPQTVEEFHSYLEPSPSGTGLRGLAYGTMERNGRKEDSIGLEEYCEAHYLTITGHPLPGHSTIEHDQASIDRFDYRISEAKKAKKKPTPTPTVVSDTQPVPPPGPLLDWVTDAHILDKAKQATNGVKFQELWGGDLAGFPSMSEGDQSLANILAFWCGPSPERIASLMRMSERMRDKFDSHSTYLTDTVRLAIEGVQEPYSWPLHDPAAKIPQGGWVPMRSLAELADLDLTINYLVEDFLAENQPMVWGGPEKSLKTTTVLALLFSLATGKPFLGKFAVNNPVPCGLLGGEAGLPVLHETLEAIARASQVDHKTVGNLFLDEWLPRLEDLGDLDKIRSTIKYFGLRVLAIDPLYLCIQDDGNSPNKMGRILRNLAEMCKSENCTPILVHHANKAKNDFKPMQLRDLSGAGYREFARQWCLLSPRETYIDGSNSFKLWIKAGGSASHQGIYGLDVVFSNKDKIWRPFLQSYKQTLGEVQDAQADRYSEKIISAMQSNGWEGTNGATMRQIREVTGIMGKTLQPALDRLVRLGILDTPMVVGRNKQRYQGYALIGDRNGADAVEE